MLSRHRVESPPWQRWIGYESRQYCSESPGFQSAECAETILFVGNSFTFGADSPPVQAYRPETVTDLNREGIGGVPALFKSFTREAGLAYDVSLETAVRHEPGFSP